jgi:beta-carotene hydroxylase
MNAASPAANAADTLAETALSPVRRGWSMSLPDQESIKGMEAPDGGRFLGWTAMHLSAWGAAVYGTYLFHGLIPLALLGMFLGSQLHAMTILQHECGHGTAFASKAANLWVGRFLAFFIFLPFTSFTEAHKRHHWYLGDPKKDPDDWYYAGGKKQLFFREMLFMPYFIVLSLRDFGPETRKTVSRELAVTVCVWGLLLGGLLYAGLFRVALSGFLIPMAWLAVVISPIARGYEHYPMADLGSADPRRKDIHANTVTVTNPVVGFFWANINYHVEHHLFPKVPFFSLPKAHGLLRRHNRFLISPFPLARIDTDAAGLPETKGPLA